MTNANIVCIDFGSSYTKIAIRSDWDQGLRITIGCSGYLGRLCVFILYCMQGPSKTWSVRFL